MSADHADADRIEPACGRVKTDSFREVRDETTLAWNDPCGHCFADGETPDDFDGRLVRSTRHSANRIHKHAADVDGTLVSEKARSDGGDRSYYEAAVAVGENGGDA